MSRPPKFDDDVLLEQALRVFWRHGWASTSIRQLETALGVKAPAIYRRFGSKEGLGAAVLTRYIEKVIDERVARYLDGSGEPLASIESFMVTAVDVPDGRLLLGCLLTNTAIDGHEFGTAFRGQVQDGLGRIERGMGREMDRAYELGLLRPGLDPDTATGVVFCAFQGLMVLARSGASSPELIARARGAISSVAVGWVGNTDHS